MEMMPRWALLALFFVICANATAQQTLKTKSLDLARGWGDDITWAASYEQGLSQMVDCQKPLMVIFHLDSCPYSQALKKAFAADETIQKMAEEDFIMLNLMEETTDENLSPDGYYVPRIIFVDPSLTVRTDIIGKYDNRRYTYQPSDMEYLAESMEEAKVLLHDAHTDL